MGKRKKHGRTRKAVEEAIKICQSEDALKASSDENYLEQLLAEFQSGKLTMG